MVENSTKLLPPGNELKVSAKMFFDYADGGWMQIYGNEEYGVSISTERETMNAPIVRRFMAGCLPGQEYETFDALRSAYNALVLPAQGVDSGASIGTDAEEQAAEDARPPDYPEDPERTI